MRPKTGTKSTKLKKEKEPGKQSSKGRFSQFFKRKPSAKSPRGMQTISTPRAGPDDDGDEPVHTLDQPTQPLKV